MMKRHVEIELEKRDARIDKLKKEISDLRQANAVLAEQAPAASVGGAALQFEPDPKPENFREDPADPTSSEEE